MGSPNAILRREIDGKVIVRTGRRIPGVRPVGRTYAPISVIRMAVGDAYGAKEWREGEGMDEIGFRTERIDRKTCRAVAEFAFQPRQADERQSLRRSQVYRQPRLRRHVERRDGRRQRSAIPMCPTSPS